jgi:uncharacterized surface protein with fasciclin (FAS1) repeats
MKRTPTRLVAFGAIAGLLALSACGSDEEATPAEEIESVVSEAVAEVEAATSEVAAEVGDIVETAINAGSFDTLVAAVQAASLVETLKSAGPFTVLAPTDDAFAALPAGLVDCRLLEENVDALSSILTYHVISGLVTSADLADGEVPTVQGENVTVDLTDGVKVNGATVVTADVITSNGVIHAVDAVLVPPTIDVEAFLATCPA